jgi:hypothetical protein
MKQSLPHLSALRAGRSISKCDKPGIDLTIHEVNDKIEALSWCHDVYDPSWSGKGAEHQFNH